MTSQRLGTPHRPSARRTAGLGTPLSQEHRQHALLRPLLDGAYVRGAGAGRALVETGRAFDRPGAPRWPRCPGSTGGAEAGRGPNPAQPTTPARSSGRSLPEYCGRPWRLPVLLGAPHHPRPHRRDFHRPVTGPLHSKGNVRSLELLSRLAVDRGEEHDELAERQPHPRRLPSERPTILDRTSIGSAGYPDPEGGALAGTIGDPR